MDKATVNPQSPTPFPLAKETLDLVLSPQQELHDALAAALDALYGGRSIILAGCGTPGAPGWLYHQNELWRVEAASDPSALDTHTAGLVPRTADVMPLPGDEPVLQRRRMAWVYIAPETYTVGALYFSTLRRAEDWGLAPESDQPHNAGNLHLQRLKREGTAYERYAFECSASAPLQLTRTAGTVRITGRLVYQPHAIATQLDSQRGYVRQSDNGFLPITSQRHLDCVRSGQAWNPIGINVENFEETRQLAHYDGLWIEIAGMFAPTSDLAVSVWSETRGEPLPAAIHPVPDDPDGETCKLVCPTRLNYGEEITLNIAYRQ